MKDLLLRIAGLVRRRALIFLWLWTFLSGFSLLPGGCSSSAKNEIVFTPIGSSFGTASLIDLEFLPGRGGEALVIAKDGTVFYMDAAFNPLVQRDSLDVLDEGEQGLLNVAADPDYASNGLVYFYGTLPSGEGNRIERATVSVDVAGGTFALVDRQTVATFLKTESPSFGANHNGGGLVFDAEGILYAAVGDGGGEAGADPLIAPSQDASMPLGKVHRIVPDRNPGEGGVVSSDVFSLGLRNPFTMVLGPTGLFIGDVGDSRVEEIDVAANLGQNFGWPITEGPSSLYEFDNPIHSYLHSDNTFAREDPTESSFDADGGEANSLSAIVGAYYQGDQYGDLLRDRVIYADFYQGWVRGFRVKDDGTIDDDRHLGHLDGLTSLQEGPDGLLYAVSLFGSDRILRIDQAEE